jgi:hypothetical protein
MTARDNERLAVAKRELQERLAVSPPQGIYSVQNAFPESFPAVAPRERASEVPPRGFETSAALH